jgi:ubiquinone biosynthesis protein COQ4
MVAMTWHKLPAHGRKAVREAWRRGRKARWLPEQDWEALLQRPLEAVRRELNIERPALYTPPAA